MFEVISAFVLVEQLSDLSAEVPESFDSATRLRADEPFELGKDGFNGIQIRAVGWQIDDFCLGLLDGLMNTGDLVTRQIVHDHKIPRT